MNKTIVTERMETKHGGSIHTKEHMTANQSPNTDTCDITGAASGRTGVGSGETEAASGGNGASSEETGVVSGETGVDTRVTGAGSGSTGTVQKSVSHYPSAGVAISGKAAAVWGCGLGATAILRCISCSPAIF